MDPEAGDYHLAGGALAIDAGMNAGVRPLSVTFAISDAESALYSLVLSKASDNPALLPTANIRFGGNGNLRGAVLTPVDGLTGTAWITFGVRIAPRRNLWRLFRPGKRCSSQRLQQLFSGVLK